MFYLLTLMYFGPDRFDYLEEEAIRLAHHYVAQCCQLKFEYKRKFKPHLHRHYIEISN